jgi:hypothetical protein
MILISSRHRGLSFQSFNTESAPCLRVKPSATPVVKFSRSTIGMTGNPLGHLQRSSLLQKIGDAGSPTRMGRECIRQPGVFEPAFEHSGCIDWRAS